MATIELEPVVHEDVDERSHEHDDAEWCHLYPIWGGGDTAACGLPSSLDPHWGRHETREWVQGTMACPICGMPVCMDCLLIAS